eukprot:g19357.t1
MEGFVNGAIKQHLLSNNMLGDVQFRFRQGHSAPDLLTALVQTWAKELNSRGEVRVTPLDIKAAFDQVWHQEALAKLEAIGIGGYTFRWLESYLAHRKTVVVLRCQSPQLQDISAGVPQDSVIDPTIFSCFINELPSIIRSE